MEIPKLIVQQCNFSIDSEYDNKWYVVVDGMATQYLHDDGEIKCGTIIEDETSSGYFDHQSGALMAMALFYQKIEAEQLDRETIVGDTLDAFTHLLAMENQEKVFEILTSVVSKPNENMREVINKINSDTFIF